MPALKPCDGDGNARPVSRYPLYLHGNFERAVQSARAAHVDLPFGLGVEVQENFTL